jgi:hypothetical protein
VGKIAFKRIVKKLTGGGAPDEAVVEAATKDFSRRRRCSSERDRRVSFSWGISRSPTSR